MEKVSTTLGKLASPPEGTDCNFRGSCLVWTLHRCQALFIPCVFALRKAYTIFWNTSVYNMIAITIEESVGKYYFALTTVFPCKVLTWYIPLHYTLPWQIWDRHQWRETTNWRPQESRWTTWWMSYLQVETTPNPLPRCALRRACWIRRWGGEVESVSWYAFKVVDESEIW